MLDIFIDLVLENSDAILEMIGLGAAAFLVYKVSERITIDNLPEFFKRALKSKSETIYKKTIGTTLQVIVKEKKEDAISLSVLEANDSDLKGKTFTFESSVGVDSSLKKGEKIQLTI